ncbi:hypothetical protein NBZ79_15335 [Sneathiella marina]|uniref:ACT domain-containing protein n=1 Tax=Sneathiella marina TaxID=2950108 RepID=A0ABY4W061_9PROT|nr:hypothetical protein [Sneathiella marina]USG60538.1 hypothetical protein NBZ79_15335 [Sneathiella marina]
MSSMTALNTLPLVSDNNLQSRPVRFYITAEIDPSVLPRILENFALRNLVPSHLQARRENDYLDVSLTVTGLSDQEAAHLELRLQNILPVQSVEMDRP